MKKTLVQKAAHQAHAEILSALEVLIDTWEGARLEAGVEKFGPELEARRKKAVEDMARALEWIEALKADAS